MKAWTMRTLALVLVLATTATACCAAPRYEFTFQNYKADMEKGVNNAGGQGWEVFDVTFTSLAAYLVCYRRDLTQPKAQYSYAFQPCNTDNAETLTNNAAHNGWELFKLVSCTDRVYCLCCRRAVGTKYQYKFVSHVVGNTLVKQANDMAATGWELLDLGYGGPSGYLVCYRRLPSKTPRYTYTFAVTKGPDVEAMANQGGNQGWELLKVVSCTSNLYCLCFRQQPGSKFAYSFDRAAGANIENKSDEALKRGWEPYRVTGENGTDMDYTDAADVIRNSVPYLVCYRH